MKTRTIIEHSQFRHLLDMEPAVTGKVGKRGMKNQLLQSVQDYFGDKWYRLKLGTRQALDFLCFTSTERGFSYASQTYLAQKGTSERTIRRVMNELHKAGLIFIAYRRNGHFNMCAKPIYFFTQHPYFSRYRAILGINDQAAIQTHDQVESCLDGSVAGNTGTLSDSTYSSPEKLSQESIKDRKNDSLPDSYNEIPDSIPEGFRLAYKRYFPIRVQSINRLYRIAHRQFWKANIEECHYESAAIHALEQMVGQMKIKRIKNKLAYWTATCKGVAQAVFAEELEKMGADLSAY